jgi:undecaprenyl-diphosphatase
MNEVALGFHNGHPEWGSDLYLWSSFPSDHAVLFFGLAMGIAMISRPLGYVAFLHAAIVDCIPRVYLGFHHPTDIIAGALIGVAGTWLFARLSALHTIAARLLAWAELRPAWFYAGLWLIVAEIATMFDSAVEILELGLNVVRTAYQHMA